MRQCRPDLPVTTRRPNGNSLLGVVLGLPAAAVGVLVARRQPRNPLDWSLLASAASLVLSTDGGLYVLLDYRLGGGLPIGLHDALVRDGLAERPRSPAARIES